MEQFAIQLTIGFLIMNFLIVLIIIHKEKLILYLKKPLIVVGNNALISFNIGSSALGFTSMNHYTALLKKVNDKWLISATYDDGIYY